MSIEDSAMPRLERLADTLLPGAHGWPSASAAIHDLPAILERLADGTRQSALAWAQDLHDLPADDCAALLKIHEMDHPAVFREILAAFYDAYYTSPAARARIDALAQAGPHEESPHVDPTLVRNVVTHRRGAMRLP